MQATFTGVFFLALLAQAFGLHFYMNENDDPQCFYIEVGKDAMIAEKHSAWEYEASTGKWVRDDSLAIEVTIDEVFDHNERVYSNKDTPFGQFHFTALEGGEHKICYRPLANGWFNKNRVKIEVDYEIGTSDLIDTKNDRAVGSITDRISQINRKLIAVRRDQMLMREREAAFRDQSEATNSQVSRLTIFQIIVLIGTCVWQVNHLRSFFTKQKLV